MCVCCMLWAHGSVFGSAKPRLHRKSRPPFVDHCPRLQPSKLFPFLCSAVQLDGEVVVVDMGLFDDNDTVVARIVNFQLIHINSLGVFARL